MRGRSVDLLILAFALFFIGLIWFVVTAKASATECEVEPASPWAPQGYICPPRYGEGMASMWGGPGVARNDCVWPFDRCERIRITSLQTGRSVVRTPVTWCMCWVGVTGPLGETERIVDLDPATVAQLGLDPAAGLWKVHIRPATGERGAQAVTPAMTLSSGLPDTAVQP